jgi:hypothetical protein
LVYSVFTTSPDTLFSLDTTNLEWKELSFMSAKRCYVGSVVLNSKWESSSLLTSPQAGGAGRP